MNMTLLHSLFFMSSRNADTKNGCVADYYEYGHVCIINQWKGWDEILQWVPCELKDHWQHGLLKRDMLWQKFPRDK